MTTDHALPTSHLDVLVQGRGPALLLAHGAGGGIEGNFGLVLDDLAQDHTLVGPHYPGAGGSAVAVDPLDLDDLADRLVAAAVAAGQDSFAVLGESLGSAVAVRIATRHPDRVPALVLTAGFAVADPVLALAAQLFKSLAAAGQWEDVARLALLSCMSPVDLADLEPAALDEPVAQTLTAMPPGMLDHFDLVSRVDVRADLAKKPSHLALAGRLSVMVGIVERLVPDELWVLFQRVVPEAPSRPQGGGRRRHGDREVLAAIVFVATSGCTWQQLPAASFGPSGATAHRRFSEWSKARVWAKLHRLVLDELGARGELDWSRCAIDSVNMRALKKGT